MSKVPEKTIKERWEALDRRRELPLERARSCAAITVPSLLLPKNYDERDGLIQQYSSVSSRGVTTLASRVLSALIPLNDTPFFRLGLTNGRQPEHEVGEFLEVLSLQIYKKLISKNLRDSIYLALQHLIVTGNACIIMDNDFSFRVIPLDQYVIRRNVQGDVKELIYVEYLSNPNDNKVDEGNVFNHGEDDQDGYDTVYIRITLEDDGWYVEKELDGDVIESGYFEVSPFITLRWTSIANEDYGRSHVEDLYGDIVTLEAYSRAMVQGMAAGSTFFMGVDPAGLTELDDLSSAQNGQWVAARAQDVFTISPSATMNPQAQISQAAVETMRKEVGNGFLMQIASMPTGERVTATAVRAIGNELESVLGGTFSAIARDLMEPLVRRSIYLMLQNGAIDPNLQENFSPEGGLLSIEIITGLQALSREGELTKLLQLGEMVRNLPEFGAKMFKWDAYAQAIVLSLGFDPKLWVKSEEEVRQEEQAAMAAQQEAQQKAQLQQTMASAASDIGTHAAKKNIDEGVPLDMGDENVNKLKSMFEGALE